MIWSLAILALILAMVLAVLASGLAGRRQLEAAKARFEAEQGPLDPSIFVLPEIEPEQNAATWIRAGSVAVAASDEHPDAGRQLFLQVPSRWTARQTGEARRIVAENREALDLLERAIPTDGSSFGVDYVAGYNAALDRDLITIVPGVRMVRLDARLALLDGDRERLLTAGRILSGIAEGLSRESTLVHTLIAIHAQQSMTDYVHDLISCELTDTEVLETADRLLRAADLRAAIERSLHADASNLASTLPDRAQGSGLGSEGSFWDRWRRHKGGPRGAADVIDRYLLVIQSLDRPLVDQESILLGSDPGSVSSFLFPNLLHALQRLRSVETARGLAHVALGLWMDRIQGDLYPETLATEGPDTETLDTYSGEPVSYELLADGGALLSAGGAIELWRETWADSPRLMPHFEWRLPEPPRAPQSFK